ncbi:MAG: hydroxymethylpyrimidine pyrophosphatase-like HAD family hydrolase, partial [Candidatus Omnitrophota bacterium]
MSTLYILFIRHIIRIRAFFNLSTNTFIKCVSWLVLGVFCLQSTGWTAPTLAPTIPMSANVALNLPSTVGSIDDVYMANHAKTIILIQDAHTNESGQMNVSKALEQVFKTYDLKYVFLEAGQGDESLSFLREYADLKQRKKVSRDYLRRGLLQGPEYFDLTTDKEVRLWGVESADLYNQALESYREIHSARSDLEHYLNRVESTLTMLQDKLYNPSLLRLNQTLRDYRQEKMSMVAYLDHLIRVANIYQIFTKDFGALNQINALREREKRIDFDLADKERQAASRQLPVDLQKRLNLFMANKDSKHTILDGPKDLQTNYFDALITALIQYVPDYSKKYVHLSAYLEYQQLSQKLQTKAVLEQIQLLEDKVFLTLSENEDEKKLIELDSVFKALKDLANLKLTPDVYQANAGQDKLNLEFITGFLNRKIMDLEGHYEKTLFLNTDIQAALEEAKNFYELTLARDQVFIQQTLDKMSAAGENQAVLITGGYHAPNLKQLLKNHGINYISVLPTIYQPTDHKRYERLLLSDANRPYRNMSNVDVKQNTLNITRITNRQDQFAELVYDLSSQRVDSVVQMHDLRSRMSTEPMDVGEMDLLFGDKLRKELANRTIRHVVTDYDGSIGNRKKPLNFNGKQAVLRQLLDGRSLTIVSGNTAKDLDQFVGQQFNQEHRRQFRKLLSYFGEQGGVWGYYDMEGLFKEVILLQLTKKTKETIQRIIIESLQLMDGDVGSQLFSAYESGGLLIEITEESRVVVRIESEELRHYRFSLADKIKETLGDRNINKQIVASVLQNWNDALARFNEDDMFQLAAPLISTALEALKTSILNDGMHVSAGGSRSVDIGIVSKKWSAQLAIEIDKVLRSSAGLGVDANQQNIVIIGDSPGDYPMYSIPDALVVHVGNSGEDTLPDNIRTKVLANPNSDSRGGIMTMNIVAESSSIKESRPPLSPVSSRNEFMERAPIIILDEWNQLSSTTGCESECAPLMYGFSGLEVSGKSQLSRVLGEVLNERIGAPTVYTLSLDRWFLDRSRRKKEGDKENKFVNKWEVFSNSDSERPEAIPNPYALKSALTKIKRGETTYIPFFINSSKQRLNISNPNVFTVDTADQIVADRQNVIEDAVMEFSNHRLNNSQIVEGEGNARFIRLFDINGQLMLDEQEINSRGNGWMIARIKEVVEFLKRKNPDLALENLLVDLSSGDFVEEFDPRDKIILIEGVLALHGDVVDDSMYDSTFWVGVGDVESLDEIDEATFEYIRRRRYILRRHQEGRLESIASVVRDYDSRQINEAPIISRSMDSATHHINNVSDNELKRVRIERNTIPVNITLDVGGGDIHLSHVNYSISKDGFSLDEGILDVNSMLAENTFSHRSSDPNNPEKKGKDYVLGQIAILILERIRDLQQNKYPGKYLFPVVSIGAPGNLDHPNFDGLTPESAANLGSDFANHPERELATLIAKLTNVESRDGRGIDLSSPGRLIWKNDSLAQGYAAAKNLLNDHPELNGQALFFLGIGTGLGQAVVAIDEDGIMSTVGDSHVFDFDVTSQFETGLDEEGNAEFYIDLNLYPNNEVDDQPINAPYRLALPCLNKCVSDEAGADSGDVPQSVIRVGAEQLLSGKAISTIMKQFEFEYANRHNQQLFFLNLIESVYKEMTDQEKSKLYAVLDTGDPIDRIHRRFIAGDLDQSERGDLTRLIRFDYSHSPLNAEMLNIIISKAEKILATDPNFDELPYRELIRFSQALANHMGGVAAYIFSQYRAGEVVKIRPSVNWTENMNEDIKNLRLNRIILGSKVATSGPLAAMFRSSLESHLSKAKTSMSPDDGLGYTTVYTVGNSDLTGIQGASLLGGHQDVLQIKMLTADLSQLLKPIHGYRVHKRDQVKHANLVAHIPRRAALFDMGDVVHSKGAAIPEKIIKFLEALLDQGIYLGVATGKPMAEVDSLLGDDLKNRISRYALNASDVQVVGEPRQPYAFNPSQYSAVSKVMAELKRYGFDFARVYDKKKLTAGNESNFLSASTEEFRDWESGGVTERPARGNMSSFFPTRANPNYKRNTVASVVDRMLVAMYSTVTGFKYGQRFYAPHVKVAGRIGMDISARDKSFAQKLFIQELFSEGILSHDIVSEFMLADEFKSLMPDLDLLDDQSTYNQAIYMLVLKIFDLYEDGQGADADMSDPWSISVGEQDHASEYDHLAPIMRRGGVDG